MNNNRVLTVSDIINGNSQYNENINHTKFNGVLCFTRDTVVWDNMSWELWFKLKLGDYFWLCRGKTYQQFSVEYNNHLIKFFKKEFQATDRPMRLKFEENERTTSLSKRAIRTLKGFKILFEKEEEANQQQLYLVYLTLCCRSSGDVSMQKFYTRQALRMFSTIDISKLDEYRFTSNMLFLFMCHVNENDNYSEDDQTTNLICYLKLMQFFQKESPDNDFLKHDYSFIFSNINKNGEKLMKEWCGSLTEDTFLSVLNHLKDYSMEDRLGSGGRIDKDQECNRGKIIMHQVYVEKFQNTRFYPHALEFLCNQVSLPFEERIKYCAKLIVLKQESIYDSDRFIVKFADLIINQPANLWIPEIRDFKDQTLGRLGDYLTEMGRCLDALLVFDEISNDYKFAGGRPGYRVRNPSSAYIKAYLGWLFMNDKRLLSYEKALSYLYDACKQVMSSPVPEDKFQYDYVIDAIHYINEGLHGVKNKDGYFDFNNFELIHDWCVEVDSYIDQLKLLRPPLPELLKLVTELKGRLYTILSQITPKDAWETIAYYCLVGKDVHPSIQALNAMKETRMLNSISKCNTCVN